MQRVNYEFINGFIHLHIYGTQTNLVEACFEHGIFSPGEIYNGTTFGQEGREMRGIYEWWLISNWLADRLCVHGEAVFRHPFGVWWGRATTGQSIAMDEVIQTIAAPFVPPSYNNRSSRYD